MQAEQNNIPLVSVITVCYNSEKTIRRTIESVLNQTYTDIEYILVDGASKDNTVEIIKEYAQQFAERGIAYRWISEPDKGIYDAMNKGSYIANGVLLAHLNSDDFFDSDSIKIVAGDYSSKFQVFSYAQRNWLKGSNISTVRIPDLSLLRRRMSLYHQATFISRDLFINLGGFKSEKFKIAGDFEFLLNAYVHNVMFFISKQVVVNFSEDGTSDRNFPVILKETKSVLDFYYGNKLVHNLYVLRLKLFRLGVSSFKWLFGDNRYVKFRGILSGLKMK